MEKAFGRLHLYVAPILKAEAPHRWRKKPSDQGRYDMVYCHYAGGYVGVRV